MTLYELTDLMMELQSEAENDDIDPQVLADTFEGLDGAFEDKAEQWAKAMKQMESDEKSLELEEKRLAERRNRIKANRERMKEQLGMLMVASGKTKFKTPLFSFGFRKSTSTEIIEGAEIPEWALIQRPPKVSKTEIKKHLDAGEELPFAKLVTKESVSIR